MNAILNHVAYLVENIESLLKKNAFPGEIVGKIEEFPSEGTRELYIGKANQLGRLLLMQAIGDGPYKDALEKRGPGLHHIALDVEDIDVYVDQLSGSGWFLHPKSLSYYNNNRQVYLSRPGIPTLIEILERKEVGDTNYFIENVTFPFKDARLLEGLCCRRLAMGDKVQLFDKNEELVCQFFT